METVYSLGARNLFNIMGMLIWDMSQAITNNFIEFYCRAYI
jgi:hypothetical protein